MSIALPHTRRPAGRAVDRAVSRVEVPRPTRRVRHEVRDGVAVIAFSAVSSTGLAGLITVLVSMAR